MSCPQSWLLSRPTWIYWRRKSIKSQIEDAGGPVPINERTNKISSMQSNPTTDWLERNWRLGTRTPKSLLKLSQRSAGTGGISRIVEDLRERYSSAETDAIDFDRLAIGGCARIYEGKPL